MRHRCSWALGGQILKCDQNFGRYYFPAPCSLPILFSAAWCNNKCYLDPISPGSRWPGMMIHLSDRPRPISWRCLWVFLSGAEPGQSEYWAGLICLWRWVMWLNITFSLLEPSVNLTIWILIPLPRSLALVTGHWSGHSLLTSSLTIYNLILQVNSCSGTFHIPYQTFLLDILNYKKAVKVKISSIWQDCQGLMMIFLIYLPIHVTRWFDTKKPTLKAS